MKNYTLYLVRHGITRANLEGIYVGGGTDLPLAQEGREDLASLAAQFTYPKVGTVFVSPMQRAVQSAQILFPGAKLLELEDLRENHLGEFENRPIAALREDAHFQLWMDPAKKYQPEGGEDAAAFHLRCAATLLRMFEYMMRSGIENAACVTHGGVIMSMLAQQAMPRRAPTDWMADPGCGYQLQTTPAMWMRDSMVEAVRILPFGYMDAPEESAPEEE